MAYQTFAHVYDELMEDSPYNDWASITEEVIKQDFKNASTIIDLGSGTGEITLKLAKKGYKLTGVDLSSDMLTIANEKSTRNKLSIQWIEQDIKMLEVPEPFDIAISFCDVINYITDEKDIRRTFERVYQSLKPNGLFIFDIHSETYVNHYLANQTFADVRENLSFIWFCEQGELESSVEHFLTFFIKNQKEQYERHDEYHLQRTFPVNSYKNILQGCGFTLLDIFTDFTPGTFNEKGNRHFFVCQKKEEA